MAEKISTKKLYVIVFLTGAMVMVLELIGSRILAPSLGTSTFVWASIIGVILGAMSLGYYYGGKAADKNPSLNTFSFIIFLAGVSVFAIIIFKQRVLDLSPYLGIKFGSVFASTFLFSVPSFLLGMVSPYAVRLDMERVESSGKTVGNLYAVSTFGSIVGTFAAGFFLIPYFGSTNILYGIALGLFAVSLFGYAGDKARKAAVAVLAIIMTTASMSAEAVDAGRFLYQGDSEYNNIRVFDTTRKGRPIRVMSVEYFFDSGMYLDGDDLALDYSKYYALDEAFGGKIGKAVIFGGAAYSVPKDFLKRNSQGSIDVVEIDPKTTEIAKKYFNLKDDSRLNVIHDDARIFLNSASKNQDIKYDAVYNDAFTSACSLPAHLTTKEALQEVYSILDDDGVYIANTISSLAGKKSIFFRAEYKTMKEIFPSVYAFSVQPKSYNLEGVQNIMLVGTKQKTDIGEIIKKYPDGNVAELLKNYHDGDIETDDVPVLTDDFAPVNYYGTAICDTLS